MSRLTDNLAAIEGFVESAGAPSTDSASAVPGRGDPAGPAAPQAELAPQVPQEHTAQQAPGVAADGRGTLPEPLMRLVELRIGIWQKLLEIDSRRAKLQGQVKIHEIEDESARQSQDLQKVPEPRALQNALKRMLEKLKDPAIISPIPPTRPPAKSPSDCSSAYRQVLDMGATQIRLLLERAELDDSIRSAALPAASGEPLFSLCADIGADAGPLLAWTYYALALEQRIDHCRSIEEQHRARLAEARAEDRTGKGFMSMLLGNARRDSLPRLDPSVPKAIRAAQKELQVIEPRLTELFWALYEDLAWVLAQEKLDERQAPVMRAFLRYGLVAVHPGLIKPETLAYIMNDCTHDVCEWDNSPQATHVVYADEYILGVVKGRVTVSPDQDLELNHRGSNEWKADRVWRQAVIRKSRSQLFITRLKELQRDIQEQQQATDRQEQRINALKTQARYKSHVHQLEEQVAMMRSRIAHWCVVAEQLETAIIPKLQDQAREALRKLVGEVRVMTPEKVARREGRFIRRMARFVGRLRESFPPFVLRDHFEPGRPDHHSRPAVLQAIQAFEQADPRVFHCVLVPNKRLDRQATVRISPTFLLAPGRGPTGFAICPRKWDDNGRAVLPILSHRPGALEDLLIGMMGDFRWECSKETAGPEWMAADALCAAYTAARANALKLAENVHRAMGFDARLKDRPNWNLHYRLFVTSAAQQGRLLFTRCLEVYAIVLKYIGLPPGVEPLKRD